VLAGGTHHAFRAEGAGFCVCNDIAVSIESLRAREVFQRFAILDLDVHQGDGTAAIFAGDQNVLTVSLHGRHNFPFRKQHSRIDVEFENNAGDADYLGALETVLPRVADFRPEILYYQAGVDPLEFDTLGKLRLSFDGLRERDRRVFQFARQMAIPLVVTLGGGYSQPIEKTVEAHTNTFLEAARWFSVA
jgi:acetoin utilization deacetylase AcuC-like enzyme